MCDIKGFTLVGNRCKRTVRQQHSHSQGEVISSCHYLLFLVLFVSVIGWLVSQSVVWCVLLLSLSSG